MGENYGQGTIQRTLKDDGDDFLNTALRKWKFNSKYNRNLKLFSALFLFFLTFGIIFIVYYFKIVEYKKRYDDYCQLNDQTCKFQLKIDQNMEQPIFFYYEIDNFYQTHRKFYQSKDVLQLRGEVRSISQLSDCEPYVTNKQMGKKTSITGKELIQDEAANPCGLIAKTYFNDTYKLYKIVDGQKNPLKIDIDENDIAWDVDKNYNYKLNTNQDSMWLNVTNEHFMVWMRTSGMGRFKKLWGRIKQNLEVGDYIIEVQNNYDVKVFNGQKSFIMTTTSAFGQKNPVLIVAYFSGAFVCLVSLIEEREQERVYYYQDMLKKKVLIQKHKLQLFQILVGVDYKQKIVEINNKKIKLYIWDTAGQEKYRPLVYSYFQNTQAAILILVGNKCDLEYEEPDENILNEYQKKYNISFLITPPFFTVYTQFEEGVLPVAVTLLGNSLNSNVFGVQVNVMLGVLEQIYLFQNIGRFLSF
ncbi:ligand-effect modulator 3 LEM3 family protein, putative [Ichthyophthirius multifiliis]|uniref:Ligand-effect modulator 3 LEM3 family protein, putative n=1 Tax=Ichthyophthirius multifiliis TaxID=5932 RepID=G0QVH5_ICHMU|nr:ligand-effect modulator 3 LEM3 family protein, putative [Ichthyophthirius multifiliis]EGR30785.1 ligand-effect modulator 3 LEM3 family protein, putative [Ichthyophthirius multifiliis]|eukprot:XP_004032372.1 ligand-effect modulator 3 LEM3 family protein, putative [Ichthyophthirius multifiliis]